MAAKDLQRRPDARTETVEDLVDRVRRGEVRIPQFQRPLNWEASDVVDLFDSVYHGYPIGSLLFRAAPAQAGFIRIGPLHLFGEETESALWVVDGQQRLTSLAAGLARPSPVAGQPIPADQFVVFFDPRTERFLSPPSAGPIPAGWVPVSRLLDAAALSEWVIQDWADGKDARLRSVVFEAAKRLRQYRVPYYVIETNDEDVAKHIFDRVNTRGKPLARDDVFNALFGHKGKTPATLRELASSLAELGMGTPDEESQLLPGLVAMRGLDVTRPFKELAHEHPEQFENAISEATPIFRHVLGFFRVHAGVPHLRLLPYSTQLIVLMRFFALHPEPNPRTTTLLVRWVWRGFLSPALDDRTLRRRGVTAITRDQEASAQALLNLVPRDRGSRYQLPERFDARAAGSRLALLALAAQEPRPPEQSGTESSDSVIDVAAAINEHDRDAFRLVFPGAGGAYGSPANRIIAPGAGSARQSLLTIIQQHGPNNPILQSHLIAPSAAEALLSNNVEQFIELRGQAVADAVDGLSDRLAEWGQNDRPSIDYLLAQIGVS